MRHLRAQRAAPAAICTYSTFVGQLARFVRDQGMPTSPVALTREHVEAFITDLPNRLSPATAHNRYRALRSFFGWLVDESEIRESPMARMKPPRLPEAPPPVRAACVSVHLALVNLTRSDYTSLIQDRSPGTRK